MLPALSTPRLRMRPADEGDLDSLWTLWTNPDVRRFLWDDVTIERKQALRTIRDYEALAPRGLGLWIIAMREDASASLVGCAGLMPVTTAAEYYPPMAGEIEPLVALDPRFQHRGFALEALTAMIRYAVDSLRLDRLVAVTDVPNAASDRMLTRAGFVLWAETDGPRHPLRHFRLDQIADCGR